MDKKDKPIIEHIVLSGAGQGLYSYYGVFDILLKEKYIDMNKIKSIYGTSAGGIIGLLLLLKIDWNIIVDYFIERPWNELYKFESENILKLIDNNGMWSEDEIKKSLQPLFLVADIDIDITLSEFYELNKVDLYFYTTQLDNFNYVELSHYSHPELNLVKAVYMSCAIPLLWKPAEYNNIYYVDGALSLQYPINKIMEKNYNEDSILGIRCVGTPDEKDDNESDHKNDLNFFTMLQYLVFNPIFKVLKSSFFHDYKLYNELDILSCGGTSLENIKETINSQEKRVQLIENAKIEITEFLNNKYNISLLEK